MGKCGIQLKPDHPALKGLDLVALQFASGDTREVRQRIEGACLEAFGRAYGIKFETILQMHAAGEIEVEQLEDASVWVSFVADMTPEEAGRALRAIGQLDPRPSDGLDTASGRELDALALGFGVTRLRHESDLGLRQRLHHGKFGRMICAVDFDGTLVRQDSTQSDDEVETLELLPEAVAGLKALKRAGVTVILFSGRANRALREDWKLNPLWASGLLPIDVPAWERNRPAHEARFQQMVAFVAEKLPGLVDAIDTGSQGKPVGVDLFIDDRGCDLDWDWIGSVYGDPDDGASDEEA